MQNYNNSNELYHHGILGMKWGVRRYQNEDGSLTTAGRKRYGTKANFEKVMRAKNAASSSKTKEKIAREKANARTEAEIAKYKKKAGIKEEVKPDVQPKQPSIKDLSDDELRAKIKRLQLENEYRSEIPEKVSFGKKIAMKFLDEAVVPVVVNAGKAYMEKVLKNALGINATNQLSEYDKLKKEVDLKDLKKRKNELDNYFERQKEKKKEEKSKTDKQKNESTTSNNQQKERNKTESNKSASGKVSGAGNSHSQFTQNHTTTRTRPDNYYDPIDVDYRDVTNTAAYDTGRNYVNQLLQLGEYKPKNK